MHVSGDFCKKVSILKFITISGSYLEGSGVALIWTLLFFLWSKCFLKELSLVFNQGSIFPVLFRCINFPLLRFWYDTGPCIGQDPTGYAWDKIGSYAGSYKILLDPSFKSYKIL